MKPTEIDLGQRIRQFRLKRQWSVSELATRLNCSRSTIKAWEAGRTAPNMHKLPGVAAVFGMSVPEFFRARITKKASA